MRYAMQEHILWTYAFHFFCINGCHWLISKQCSVALRSISGNPCRLNLMCTVHIWQMFLIVVTDINILKTFVRVTLICFMYAFSEFWWRHWLQPTEAWEHWWPYSGDIGSLREARRRGCFYKYQIHGPHVWILHAKLVTVNTKYILALYFLYIRFHIMDSNV